MSADPFSSLLSLVDAHAACAGRFEAGGSWAIAFPRPEKLKFFVMARGACWLTIDGEKAAVHLREGDVCLLTLRQGFALGSDPLLKPVSAADLPAANDSSVLTVGEGSETMLIGGHVALAFGSGRLLLDNLPPVVHLDAGCAQAPALQWLVRQLVDEYSAKQAGGDFACVALAQLIFLHILRAHLERAAQLAPSWLRAMSDARLVPVLRLMHSEPGRNWRLRELASAAAMSRSAFAARFKTVAGIGPLAYLTQLRMRLAERWLIEGNLSITHIARATGFASDAAFSNAFKRHSGRAPSHYRSVSRDVAVV